MSAHLSVTHDLTREVLNRRVGASTVVAELADQVTAAAEALAARCASGGRLLVVSDEHHSSDARHIAVEFLHPVIVGKKALPAVVPAPGRVPAIAPVPGDAMVAVVGPAEDTAVASALAAGRARGLLTMALVAGPGPAWEGSADHVLSLGLKHSAHDDDVAAEVMVTLYHVLWEMTHAFLDGPADSAPDAVAVAGDEGADAGGAMAGLYPFLYGGAGDQASEASRASLRDEVARSVRGKAGDADQLRARAADHDSHTLGQAALAVASRLTSGGRLFAFGNGGSSADAAALVDAMCRHSRNNRPLPAFDLTVDTATLTALTNDVNFDVVFARQLRALGGEGDIALGLSTSGGSPNVLAGLAEAAAMGMTTVALAGYDGGALAEADCVQHLLVVPSSSVHRIQEVQATLYRALVEVVAAA